MKPSNICPSSWKAAPWAAESLPCHATLKPESSITALICIANTDLTVLPKPGRNWTVQQLEFRLANEPRAIRTSGNIPGKERPTRALTCDALEWQASQGGGRIIEPDGTISVNNPRTVDAIKRAKSWIGRISPPGVLEYKENDSRNLWFSGNAALRDCSWWSPDPLVEHSPAVMRAIAVAPLPRGSFGRAAVVGGYSVGL